MGSRFTRRRRKWTYIFIVEIDHHHLDLAGLVKKLRYVTAAVQVMPFIYSLIYIISMVLYLFCSEKVAGICDSLFYVSPATIASFLILSRLLRMCVWHRVTCLMPLIPQALSLVDRYLIEFPLSAGTIIICLSAFSFVLLLFSAYKTFIKWLIQRIILLRFSSFIFINSRVANAQRKK